MLNSNIKYTIIRKYHNLYGLEELVRRIIRHHVNDSNIETELQGCSNHKVKNDEEQFHG